MGSNTDVEDPLYSQDLVEDSHRGGKLENAYMRKRLMFLDMDEVHERSLNFPCGVFTVNRTYY